MGELVWVEDAGEAWLPALVRLRDDDYVVVKLDPGGAERRGDLAVLPRAAYADDAAAATRDLTALTHLNEAEILRCLRARLGRDRIYTACGPILLALNPFKELPALYDASTLARYARDDDDDDDGAADADADTSCPA